MRLLHPGRANSAKNMNEITDLVLYWSEWPVYFECERYTRKGQELGRIWLPGTKREASKEIVNSCLVLLSRGQILDKFSAQFNDFGAQDLPPFNTHIGFQRKTDHFT